MKNRLLFLIFSCLCIHTAFAQISHTHQLGTVDVNGNALVVQATGKSLWMPVYEGHLEGCLMSDYHFVAHHQSQRSFHMPLSDGFFAFGCDNGFLYLGRDKEDPVKIRLPSGNRSWFEYPYFHRPFTFWFPMTNIPGWYNSPVYLAYSQKFYEKYNKNWLFVSQRGYLFIIDVDRQQLVSFPGWKQNRWYQSYLPMGENKEGTDHTKPMAGMSLYEDHSGDFHLLATMERNLKEGKFSAPLFQYLPLKDGELGNEWFDIKKDGDKTNVLQYACTDFDKKGSPTGMGLKGDISALCVDQSSHTAILRGHHRKLVAISPPVKSANYKEVRQELKGEVIGYNNYTEPAMMSNNRPEFFRINEHLYVKEMEEQGYTRAQLESLGLVKENKDKLDRPHHMLTAADGMLYSADADHKGHGSYVYRCNLGELPEQETHRHAWKKPLSCKWKVASSKIPAPAEVQGLEYAPPGVYYYQSFVTFDTSSDDNNAGSHTVPVHSQSSRPSSGGGSSNARAGSRQHQHPGL